MDTLNIHGKTFEKFISFNDLYAGIQRIAQQINSNHRNEDVLFLGILNGAFMFAGDLLKFIDFHCYLSFIKLASYEADSSTGEVKQLVGFNEEIDGKTVIIMEDIVDTGTTLDYIINSLEKHYNPAKIKLATLLYKPDIYQKNHPVDYYVMDIPDYFLVGYGLDYNGYGRNFKDVYRLADS